MIVVKLMIILQQSLNKIIKSLNKRDSHHQICSSYLRTKDEYIYFTLKIQKMMEKLLPIQIKGP